MRRLRTLLHLIDNISEYTGRATAYLLIPLTVLVFMGVVLRYGFNSPTEWGQETSVYLFGTIGMWAGVYTYLHRAHVRMDVVYSRLSPRVRATIDSITGLLFFFYLIMMVIGTGMFAIEAVKIRQVSPSPWGPPLYPIKIVAVIGVFLVLLQGIPQYIRNLYYAIRGKEII